MKVGQMAEAIARCVPAEVSSVKVVTRFLGADGRITHGAHGVNAPDMMALDVAKAVAPFLIDSAPGRRCVAMLDALESLRLQDTGTSDHEFSLEALRGLKAPFSFAQALAALIEVYAFGQDTEAFKAAGRRMRDDMIRPPACVVEVCFEGDEPAATIKMGPWRDAYTAQYFFNPLPLPIREAMAREQAIPPVASLRWITDRNIKPLAEEFARMT